MAKLLIVESPSKAKTLEKYLGGAFTVLASYGHVRDIIPKSGAVDPANNFHIDYEPLKKNAKYLSNIIQAVKGASEVYLATDPDREGEAISWHLMELLREKNLLKNKLFKRVVFHEITKSAVQSAIAAPRDINLSLVNAQQARRVLDYLVGFNLSPLLWKKIRRGLSAGRVQSPALRLIVEREQEIEAFKQQEYWTIHLNTHKDEQAFVAKLNRFEHEKIEQFQFSSEQIQQSVVEKLTLEFGDKISVIATERKQKSRNPAPPFTTSTLQQEAVRKLGFTTSRAMRIAQQLYEGISLGSGETGLITYMRTDSVHLSQEAITQIRGYIDQHFSADYLPSKPIFYQTKTKNAQEAHEAIRPTDINRTPENVKKFLSDEQFKLYEIIWKRSLASQITSARFSVVNVDLGNVDYTFRASGQTLLFPGFLKVYEEGIDDSSEEDQTKLPPLETGDVLPIIQLFGEQHFTEPPPRYSEASLVKSLEEHGIGRPSTYASIISTLQDREYATIEKKRFHPSEIGRVVNKFLTTHFTSYVDYDFTAKLENDLDDVAEGITEWIPLLDVFWKELHAKIGANQDVERPGTEVTEEQCPQCGKFLEKRLGRYGSFIACPGYKDTPPCTYKRNNTSGETPEPIILGKSAEKGDIVLIKGPYGYYVQENDPHLLAKEKPKRKSLPSNITPEKVTLQIAQHLLELPKELGKNPETGEKVVVDIGRFGPYVRHDKQFYSIPRSVDMFTMTLDMAIEVIQKKGDTNKALRDLGEHPQGGVVAIYSGKFGPYVQYKKTRASLPKSESLEEITLEQAIALLADKESAIKKPVSKKPVTKKTVKKK